MESSCKDNGCDLRFIANFFVCQSCQSRDLRLIILRYPLNLLLELMLESILLRYKSNQKIIE
jgi:hypothetical protein